MRALVVYESMFGNTRAIAEAIGEGLSAVYSVDVRNAGTVSRAELEQADLIVAGGPTHAWGISRPSTREGALKQAEVPGSGLKLETGATGPGLRELFAGVTGLRASAAAFDTRIDKPAMVTGRASRKIARLLKRSGCNAVARPESFLVSGKPTTLVPGEDVRARGWGSKFASSKPAVDRHPQ
ncbi:MAG: flavodoxin family protein [Actinomycetales bacterium]